MATVKLDLKVAAQGLDPIVKQSEAFKMNMEAGARAPGMGAAGLSGASGTSSPKGPSYAKAKKENTDYNTARGVGMGSTGSATSDFSRQASGLGGLVHLYATFAANIFAASAAFTALKTAADTSNLVRGLDQLGASSGRALGSLAKQVAAVSDGAIDMRASMLAVSQASSGGMGDTQILRLTEAAKKAGQALGVGMPEALSRLTRGITKIEPELLDELGIMVRVDTASANYAKTIGKTASTLTDFEKRQGFANAVLDQAEAKFKNIKLDSNPYDKLIASVSNLAQSGLSLVNTVLGPIANLLAKSPEALAGALGLLATVLVKQAIPALGAFRETSKRAAEEARALANTRSAAAADYGTGSAKKAAHAASKLAFEEVKARNLMELSERDKFANKMELNAEQLAKKTMAIQLNLGKVTNDILSKEAALVDAKDFTKLKSQATRLENKGKTQAAGLLRENIAMIEATQAAERSRNEFQERAILSTKEAQEKKMLLDKEASNLKAKYFSVEGQLQAKALAANKAAEVSAIASNAGEVFRAKGLVAAYRETNAEIAKRRAGPTTNEAGDVVPKFGMLTAGFARAKSAINVATSAVEVFGNAINKAFFFVGIFTAAFALLDGVFSNNSKAADTFKGSLDLVNSSAETMAETMKVIKDKGDKNPLEAISVESISAANNAMQGLSSAVSKLAKDFKAVQAVTNEGLWDTGMNNFATGLGFGQTDKLAASLASSISAAIKGMPIGPGRDAFIAKMSQIYRTSDLSSASLKKAGKRFTDEQASIVAEEVDAALAVQAKAQQVLTASFTEGVAGFDKIKSSFLDLQNTLIDTSPVGKFASSMIAGATDMSKALEDPANALNALADIVKDTGKLKLLPIDTQRDLLAAADAITLLADKKKNLDADAKKAQEEQGKAKQVVRWGANTPGDKITADLVISSMSKTNSDLKERYDEIHAQEESLLNKHSGIMKSTWQQGVDLMTMGFDNAASRASITLREVSVSRVTGPGAATLQAELKNEELSIQREEITTMFRLINTIETNSLIIQRDTAVRERAEEGSRSVDRINLKKIDSLSQSINTLDARISFRGKGPQAGKADFAKLSADAPDAAKAETGYLQQLMQVKKQLVGIDAKAGANILEAKYKEAEAERVQLDKKATAEIVSAKSASDRLKTVAAIADVENLAARDSARDSENKVQAMQDELELAQSKFKYKQLVLALTNAGKLKSVPGQKAVEASALEISDLKAKQKDARDAKSSTDAVTRIGEELKAAQKRATIDKEILDTNRQLEDLRSTKAKSELDHLVQIGAYTSQMAISEASAMEQKSLTLIRNRAIEDSTLALKMKEMEIGAQVTSQTAAMGNTPEAKLAGATELARLTKEATDSEERKLAVVMATFNVKSELLSVELQNSLLLDKQAKSMETMVEATTSLSAIFGEIGQAMGESLQSMAKFAAESENRANKEAKAQKELTSLKDQGDSYDQPEIAKREADLSKLKRKNAKDELTDIANIAGTGKKMFGEKTVAYKVLDGIEKASHVAKLAMMAAEVVGTISTMAAKLSAIVAGEAAGNAAKTPGVFMSFLSSLGPWGMAAAGVAIAAVLGGAGGGGGGATVDMTGMTAKERQGSQGTGQSLNANRELVDNGRGVYGDSTAKSQSIVNSLRIIKETSVEGITYNQDMVRLLTSINDGIGEAASRLFNVQGLTKGSGFGTEQGSSTGGNWLTGNTSSSTSITDSGIKFIGTFFDMLDIATARVSQYEDVLNSSSSSGFLGLFGGGSSSSLTTNIKALDKKVISGLVGVFRNAGEVFQQQGKQLGRDAASISAVFKTIDLSQYTTSLQGLKGTELQEAITNLISSVMDDTAEKLFPELSKFKKFGEGMQQTVTRVLDTNSKIGDAFTSMGLTLPKLSETISSVPTALLEAKESSAAGVKAARVALANKEALVTSFNSTSHSGGDSYEQSLAPNTTAEVQALNIALAEESRATNAVTTATGLSTTNNFAVTESLAQMAGGVDKFLASAKSYQSHYLTQKEIDGATKKALVTNMSGFTGLNSVLSSVGLSSIKNTGDFRKVVEGIDNTTESGRKLFTSMMSVEDSFYKLSSAVESVVAGIAQSVDSSIFDMKYGMGTTEEKYALIDARANDNYKNMKKEGNSIQEIGGFADSLIADLNKGFGLLTEDQKRASFAEYQARLLEIKTFVKDSGATAFDIQEASDVRTANTMASAVKASMDDSNTKLVAAISGAITTAMRPAVVAISTGSTTPTNINLQVTAPRGSEVSIQ